MTKKQYNNIITKIRQSIFPLMRLNQNMPGAVVYGPEEYGGMELPKIYTLQDQLQMSNVIKQLQWDQTLANNILVTLDNIQLTTGLI